MLIFSKVITEATFQWSMRLLKLSLFKLKGWVGFQNGQAYAHTHDCLSWQGRDLIFTQPAHKCQKWLSHWSENWSLVGWGLLSGIITMAQQPTQGLVMSPQSTPATGCLHGSVWKTGHPVVYGYYKEQKTVSKMVFKHVSSKHTQEHRNYKMVMHFRSMPSL